MYSVCGQSSFVPATSVPLRVDAVEHRAFKPVAALDAELRAEREQPLGIRRATLSSLARR